MTIQASGSDESNSPIEETPQVSASPEQPEQAGSAHDFTESPDDDATVIVLDEPEENGDRGGPDLSWVEQPGTERETQRRNVLLRELRRVQKTSFLHFTVLC